MSEKKKYRVFLKMSELLEATVEAESEEEAWQLAKEGNVGEFDLPDERDAEWEIYAVREEKAHEAALAEASQINWGTKG